MLTLFYIPFCTLVVPGVMLTRKVGPRWTIPGYMVGWASMCMINAGASNFAGTLIIRLRKRYCALAYSMIELTDATVLGAFEAGFAASLIFYLTTFYTRGELGKVSRGARH
jgi:hypothetical protein